MSWGKTDNANNAPIWSGALEKKKANTANRDSMYGNSVFGADTTEAGLVPGIAHAGWQYRKVGTGSLQSLTIVSGGTGYANTDTIRIVSEKGANGAASITTNGSGVITAVNITTKSSGHTKKSPTVSITTSAGTGANIVAAAGGRAGRVEFETLVAMKSMTGDGSDDTILPDS